jgi:S-DNA-T family DNA segregation ATPase FtsK/SpoIIIE
MTQQYLDLQADKVERVLADFGVQAYIYGGQILPHVIVHQIRLATGCRLSKLQNLHEEIALALGVPGVLIRRVDGAITIEIPRTDAQSVLFSQFMAGLNKAPVTHTALLGLSNEGRPLMLYFPSPNVAHVLIAGMTGSGKTELLRTMLVSLATWGRPRDIRFYLVDPKQRKLAELSGLRGVEACCGAEKCPGLLEQLLAMMEDRDQRNYSSPRIYLVLDELADLVLAGGKDIEIAVTRLLQRGREAGIHVIATTQRPSASVLQGLMRANFPVRISGAVNSATEAAIATGMPQTGAEKLLGKGDMIVIYQGQATRFKAILSDSQAIEGAISEVAPAPLPGDGRSLKARLASRLRLVKSAGRPAEAPTEEMITFAMSRLEADGECSQRSVRGWHQAQYGSDVNSRRAAAAIEEAERRLAERALRLSS